MSCAESRREKGREGTLVIGLKGSMGGCKACQWIVLLLFLQGSFEVKSHHVDITYVKSAVEKGAVCLDGSPPAYHFSPGFGAGVDSWLIQLDGGGWCDTPKSCLHRRDTGLGSSEAMEKQVDFSGILSNIQQSNPDFYNWNMVRVRYCDGSSFTGDVEDVDPHTKLHYRGARVFQAIMEELLAKGMNNAKQALFSGCSAGALAVILHCDNFRSLLPRSAKVKCLSDAGYFINARDITGTPRIQPFFESVVKTHGSAKNLPSSCTSKMRPGLCFFPQNVARDIQTPLFILNGAYDSWQIKNILAPRSADPRGTWKDCKANIRKCSRNQLHFMQVYRKWFLIAIEQGGMPSSRGFYISSCYVHCQARGQGEWLAGDSPRLYDTRIGEAVGDWYFDRRPFQKIDCPYPCNKSCHNRVYKENELDDSI